MAGEDNTLTMVVLPGRCAGPSWGKGGVDSHFSITKPTTDRDGRCHSEVIPSFYTGYPHPRVGTEAVPNANSMDYVAHRGGDLHRNCRVDGQRGHLARRRIGCLVDVSLADLISPGAIRIVPCQLHRTG